MSALPPYVYESLETPSEGKTEIRLVTILPDAMASKVCCAIAKVDLQSAPVFGAFSYVWGDPGIRRPIEIDGHELLVTANLEWALRRLRYVDRSRVFWIDAICVDQSNLVERSEQVQLMAKLYQDAEQVIIWLGEEEEDTKLAFRMIEDWALAALEVCDRPEIAMMGLNTPEVKRYLEDRPVRTGTTEEKYPQVDLSARLERALQRVFSLRTWWTRYWTVQELVFARKAVLVCGLQSVPWDLVDVIFVGRSLQMPLLTTLVVNTLFKAFTLCMLKHTLYSSRLLDDNSITFEFLIGWSVMRQCHDPKDAIYALLGMSCDTAHIIPNYQKSISTIYIEATQHLIREMGNLDAVCTTVREYPRDQMMNNTDIPSWVPNFAGELMLDSLVHLRKAREQLYRASGESVLSSETLSTDRPAVLKLNGISWDIIAHISDRISDENDDVFRGIVEWGQDMTQDQLYPTGESKLDAFWRTLVRDKTQGLTKDQQGRLQHESIPVYRNSYLAWSRRFNEGLQTAEEKAQLNSSSILFKQAIIPEGFRFCVTRKGYMGLVQGPAIGGDAIYIVYGSCVPMILREHTTTSFETEGLMSEGQAYTLVGTAYIHGIMDGEVIDAFERGDVTAETIFLV